jgi:hypothetical protein
MLGNAFENHSSGALMNILRHVDIWEVNTMREAETVQGVQGYFYSALLNGREQSVRRIEQFWSTEGTRIDYSDETDLYIARDKHWLHLDHVRKEVQRLDADEVTAPVRIAASGDAQRLLLFMQRLFRQAGVKVTDPKRWKGNYLGVPAAFTELHTVTGEICFQLVLGTIDRWTLPLRLITVMGADNMFVWDTLSVRKQQILKGLFVLPRDYKMLP